MFDIFINELFENGPVIRVPEQTIILKYFDLGLKVHSSEPFRCLTQSKDVKCFLNEFYCPRFTNKKTWSRVSLSFVS